MTGRKEQAGLAEYIIIAATLLATGLVGYVSNKFGPQNTSKENATMNQREFIEALNNQSAGKQTPVDKSRQALNLLNQQKEKERAL